MHQDQHRPTRIAGIQRRTRGRFCEIHLEDGRTLTLRRDVAADHGLQVGQVANSQILEQADSESRRREAWSVAMRYLSRSARSEHEIRSRLLGNGFEPIEVHATIERLQVLGYVDDTAFALEFVEWRRGKRACGRALVSLELSAKGVDPKVATDILDASYGDELEVARPIAEQRAHLLRKSDFRSFRRRLGNYLQRRGFAHDTVATLVSELWEVYGHKVFEQDA